MNSVNIIGRLTKDPETRKLQDGTTLCNLRIAIDDAHSKDDRTDFINVTVFGAQGDVCERYLRKGFLCGVSGRLRSDVYTDQEGVKRYPVKLTADRVQFVQWPERAGNRNVKESESVSIGENGYASATASENSNDSISNNGNESIGENGPESENGDVIESVNANESGNACENEVANDSETGDESVSANGDGSKKESENGEEAA